MFQLNLFNLFFSTVDIYIGFTRIQNFLLKDEIEKERSLHLIQRLGQNPF